MVSPSSPSLRMAGAVASLAAFLCLLACAPVLAHNASELGVAPDQYDQGIPVYWPYHAGLMTVGFVLLLSGAVVMRYHRTGHWFRNHQWLQAIGGLAVVAGLSIGIYMVELSDAEGGLHGALGGGTIAVILAMLGLGLVITRSPGVGKPVRQAHRWLGWTAIALVAVNIAMGLAMIPSMLAR